MMPVTIRAASSSAGWWSRLASALLLVTALAGDARADGFLDDVEAGRSAVLRGAAVAATTTVAERTAAVQRILAERTPPSPAFTIGATLAALDADRARPPAARAATERTLVAQLVRELLAAQGEAGIGNRALCLLSGRPDPKSIERQIRLVEPRWTCERH